MALLNIEKGTDNKILRTKSAPIKKPDKKLGKFLDDMRATMLSANGVGLAAPQVGKNIRVCICLLNQGTNNELIVDFVNPVITNFSEEMEIGEEGCLSLPGQFGNVARHKSVSVKFLNRKGEEQLLKLEGLNATIVQHEIDHLDGKLFVDRVEEQVVRGVL